MALTVLVPALVVAPGALMRLGFHFKEIAVAQVAGEIVGGMVGVPLALAGHELVALVLASVSSQGAAAALLWILYRRTTRRHRTEIASVTDTEIAVSFERGLWRDAAAFGAAVSVGSLLWLLAIQGDNVVVGHVLGTGQLGLYTFAYTYGILPGAVASAIVNEIALPVLSLAPTRRSNLFVDYTVLLAALLAPVTAVGIAYAAPAIRVVLGADWSGSVAPIRFMFLLGFVRAIFPTQSLLRASGRVKVEPAIGLVGGPLTIVVAIVVAHRGLVSVAVGVLAVAAASELAAMVLATNGSPDARRRVLAAPLPAITLSAVAVVPIRILSDALTLGDVTQLAVAAPLSLAVAALLLHRTSRTSTVVREHVFGTNV